MKQKAESARILIALVFCAFILSSCSVPPKKIPVRVLIIPKFEIGEMAGDSPGEAQLFYERYCADCEEIDLPGLPGISRFYLNEKTGAALLLTGSGKTPAGISLTALLSSDLYDFSDTVIVSVGCGGGNMDYTTLGDVVVVTAACDYDLGHHVDSSGLSDKDGAVTWFPDESFDDYGYKLFDADLCEKVYQLTKDCPLQTTDLAKKVLSENYAGQTGASREPIVLKGTALTGDNYWKGPYGHRNAEAIAQHYGVPDPYAVTEMEEIAVAGAAKCFDMLDRVISIRVIVNTDTFTNTETPESLWGERDGYNEKVSEENSETLDVFEPAMHNLFDVSSLVIDAVLEGTL